MSFDKKKFEGVFGDLIFKDDDRIESYREDTMMRGDPDAVLRARDEKEVREALIYCNHKRIPATFCASQTSMTGASVATEGLLISTEKLEGIIDIGDYKGRNIAIIRPGTVVADAQNAISESGFFYPVAPTSRDECRIGANASTNATGEDSFKYGPMRGYIRRLKVILADGTQKELERSLEEIPPDTRNRAGYFEDWKDPIDLFIGSEGTLGFISELMVDLLPKPPEFFSALAPFPSNMKAIECLLDTIKNKKPSLRALEFIDSGAFAAMKTADGIPRFPEGTQALLYFKEEFRDEKEKESAMISWLERVNSFAYKKFADSIMVAETTKQKEALRLWRHRIPEWSNEEGRRYWPQGGGKIGSDWWVPTNHILEMMNFFYSVAEEAKLPFMAYAHLGSGHPHTNTFTKNQKEKALAEEMLLRCCVKAVELGGGVAGEHGIGKIHTNLLSIQHRPQLIEKMQNWKKDYDPNWILGRGNIFALNA